MLIPNVTETSRSFPKQEQGLPDYTMKETGLFFLVTHFIPEEGPGRKVRDKTRAYPRTHSPRSKDTGGTIPSHLSMNTGQTIADPLSLSRGG